LNGTHQFLVCADAYLARTITLKKNTEAQLDTSKEVVLELNAEKTKYILMSHHHSAEQ